MDGLSGKGLRTSGSTRAVGEVDAALAAPVGQAPQARSQSCRARHPLKGLFQTHG